MQVACMWEKCNRSTLSIPNPLVSSLPAAETNEAWLPVGLPCVYMVWCLIRWKMNEAFLRLGYSRQLTFHAVTSWASPTDYPSLGVLTGFASSTWIPTFIKLARTSYLRGVSSCIIYAWLDQWIQKVLGQIKNRDLMSKVSSPWEHVALDRGTLL